MLCLPLFLMQASFWKFGILFGSSHWGKHASPLQFGLTPSPIVIPNLVRSPHLSVTELEFESELLFNRDFETYFDVCSTFGGAHLKAAFLTFAPPGCAFLFLQITVSGLPNDNRWVGSKNVIFTPYRGRHSVAYLSTVLGTKKWHYLFPRSQSVLKLYQRQTF